MPHFTAITIAGANVMLIHAEADSVGHLRNLMDKACGPSVYYLTVPGHIRQLDGDPGYHVHTLKALSDGRLVDPPPPAAAASATAPAPRRARP